jgi:hypothetical protein
MRRTQAMTPNTPEDVSPERLAELIRWLDCKWYRHHEEEDWEAANALRELQRRRAENRWVPVSERLPERNGFYLVSSSEPWSLPNPFVLEFCDAEYPSHAHFRADGGFVGHVTAWCHLPPPYVSNASEEGR